ncbi:orotidine-5'-phosphate decarboxylase [Ornithinimicrobium sp. Arc0846-15]|nr:orotidine-5'-phosphate decarboxylase [Ornithinimicrobium laminariae]
MSTDRVPFTQKLLNLQVQRGPLSVGIDPHPFQLEQWGLADTPAGVRQFAESMASAAIAAHVASVKPQAAFFERHGSAGVAVLEETLGTLRAAGVLTILDAKRGDIGTTIEAYAQSCLQPGAPLEADAVTVSPFLGYGSLTPAIELAGEHQRGVYVLALTSNPEAASIQDVGAPSIAQRLIQQAEHDNHSVKLHGVVGLVIGATTAVRLAHLEPQLAMFGGSILAPGVGAQGATARSLASTFAHSQGQLVVPISRAVAEAGPDVAQLVSRIEDLNQELRLALL